MNADIVDLEVAVERDEASAPFFDAARQGTLLIRRCPSCERWYAPHLGWCTSCAGSRLEWQPAAGTAQLVSWGVAHARRPDGGAATVPVRVLGLVELDEGPWLHTVLRVADPGKLRRGTPLHVEFAHPEDGEPVPVFVPIEGERP